MPASDALFFVNQGYAPIAYSGLGFGNSTCAIELDAPAYDGVAASDVIDFPGGDLIRASAPPVLLEDIDHDGDTAVSPKLDTFIAQATWNDLGDSLAPNNQQPGHQVTQTETSPGVTKREWDTLLGAGGIANPVQGNGGQNPSNCLGHDTQACAALSQLIATVCRLSGTSAGRR